MLKKFKIFISGNQRELKDERFAIKELVLENVLLKEYFNVFLFEDSPAKGKSAKSLYIEEVSKSDIYIGILGDEYGIVWKNKISATEEEFKEACNSKNNKEILIYIKGKDDNKRDKKIQYLISKIRKEDTGYKYKRFNTIYELKNNIYESLIDFLGVEGIITNTLFDSSVCENSSFDDIDEEKVRWFLQLAKNQRKFSLNLNTPIKEFFIHLNLLNAGKLTNAAVLLFSKNPQRYHLQSEIKCLHLHGIEIEKPFETYHIYKGILFNQIDSALDFVLDRLKRPVIPEHGKATTERPFEIPEFVIREAIVNAIAHRDYNTSASVQVNVFVDRIEVWNPGKLPPKLTIEALKKPHPSIPYNPLICEPLYLTQYIERAGSGTVEMVKQCKEHGLPEPEFIQKMGHFVVVIWRDIFTDAYLAEMGLNERQLKAVKYVKEKGRITNKEYRLLNNISDESARVDLKNIVKKNIFKTEGRGRSISYVLKSGN